MKFVGSLIVFVFVSEEITVVHVFFCILGMSYKFACVVPVWGEGI